MSTIKTVTHHIPEMGIYLYARTMNRKTSLIVLNSSDQEQVLPQQHFQAITNNRKQGVELGSKKQVDLTQSLTLAARQSMIIEL